MKKVEKLKFFQKTAFPKRYMIIDFSGHTIYIKHQHSDPNEDSRNSKPIEFRDILGTMVPDPINDQVKIRLKDYDYAF